MPSTLRRTLLVAISANIVGAIIFFPYSGLARQILGLPLASSFYLLLISFWLVLFALMFWRMLRRDAVNEEILFLSALGKLSFAALVFAFVVNGRMGFLMSIAGLTDVILAGLFLRFVKADI